MGHVHNGTPAARIWSVSPRVRSAPRVPARIRNTFHEEGELSAITDHAQTRVCARTIAGWQPLPAAPCPVVPLRPGKNR